MKALALELGPQGVRAEGEAPELRAPARSAVAAIARQQAFIAVRSSLGCCGARSPKFPFVEVLIRTASKV